MGGISRSLRRGISKRQQAEDEYRTGLAAHRDAAAALCEHGGTSRAAVGERADQRIRAAGRMAGAFETVGELPRTDARSFSARFERALDSLPTAGCSSRKTKTPSRRMQICSRLGDSFEKPSGPC